jgi:hypothetical protein
VHRRPRVLPMPEAEDAALHWLDRHRVQPAHRRLEVECGLAALEAVVEVHEERHEAEARGAFDVVLDLARAAQRALSEIHRMVEDRLGRGAARVCGLAWTPSGPSMIADGVQEPS